MLSYTQFKFLLTEKQQDGYHQISFHCSTTPSYTTKTRLVTLKGTQTCPLLPERVAVGI